MTVLRIRPPKGVHLEPSLPVEVRRTSLALVTRSTLGSPLEVEHGTYIVTVRRPSGEELTGAVEATGEKATVELELDDDSRAASAEAPQRSEAAPAPAAVPGIGTVARLPQPLLRLLAPMLDTAAGRRLRRRRSRTPTVRILAGNPLAGDLREVRALDEHELHEVTGYAPDDDAAWPAFVQVLQRRADPWQRALPVAAGRRAFLRPVLDAHGNWTVDITLGHPAADLLVRYRDEGLAQEAATVAEGLESRAEELLFKKLEDPVAAAAGGYTLLRFSELERLHDWTENLRAWFPRLPDGAALRGEHLARDGQHHAALDAFGELLARGLPLFADGLAYAVTRLETYASVGERAFEPSQIARIQAVLTALRPFARQCDFSHPITTFSGEPGDLAQHARVRADVLAPTPAPVA